MTARCVGAVVALLPCAVVTESLRSCGSGTDHLQRASISVSPDPIVKGKPFTFEITGDLDEDLTEFLVDVDVDVKYLALFSTHFNSTSRISVKPKIPKGPTQIEAGPIVLDEGWFGVATTTSGTVKVSNAKGEAVACLQLQSFTVGSEQMVGSLASQNEIAGFGKSLHDSLFWGKDPVILHETQDCGTSKDHLKNLNVTGNETFSHITFDLDEPFNEVKLSSSNAISYGWLRPKISVTAPIKYSPGFPAGPFEWNVSSVGYVPPSNTSNTSNTSSGVSVRGNVLVQDGNGETMMCRTYTTGQLSLDDVVV